MDSLQPGQTGRSGGAGGIGHVSRKGMSVREFCETMGLSHSSVHKLIREKTILSAKILGKRIINAGEPERLLSGEAK
jgi:hypothetical protein